ncbi:Uncharacterised protein [uncultured archaeon]|nr:Uncharacterised protein [uncultured archaeon]
MVKFQIVNRELKLTKELNDIDKFVLKTTEIISKYADYVIVSGYVAIFFGRSRASEDVDMFIKEITLDKFREMYEDFLKKGFEWNIDNPEELYREYLQQGTPISVWEKEFPLLRLDMKLPKKMSQRRLFDDKIKIIFNTHILWMASIESTIAYKQEIAKSEKDLLDAKHLSTVFENLDKTKIEKYKKLFREEF